MSTYVSRRSPRLQGFDYAQSGAYFLTLCVEQRLSLFGAIEGGTVHPSPAGEMVAAVWGDLGTHYSGVEVDSYVVMPNHLHGIILLAGDEPGSSPKRSSLSISEVMRRFKSFTTHEYGVGVRQHGWPAYPGKLWQARFYDRIIRNERELVAIRQYIEQNPQRWELDSLNPALRG